MNNLINNRSLISLLLAITLLTTSACNNKRLRQIGTIVAVGIAAKLIYDMVVDYQSKQVNDEAQVAERYKKLHGQLPENAVLVDYESSIKPGDVVSAGTSISIQSRLEVVRSASSRQVDIQEKIIIFDNDDPTKELKSLTKVVNAKTKTSGAFVNEFTFKLPKGMPQGVYPVRTQVIINGQPYAPVNSQMQLVDVTESFESLVASY